MTTNIYNTAGFDFTGASSTQGPFHLAAGTYAIACTATFSSGSVILQILGPDNATYVNVGGAAGSGGNFTSAGYQTVQLPDCTVQVAITTVTAVAFSATRIGRVG